MTNRWEALNARAHTCASCYRSKVRPQRHPGSRGQQQLSEEFRLLINN